MIWHRHAPKCGTNTRSVCPLALPAILTPKKGGRGGSGYKISKTSYAMDKDSGIFGWGRLGYSTEDMALPYHRTFRIATDPTSDTHSFLPQVHSAVDSYWVDQRPGPLDIASHTHDLRVQELQVNREVYLGSAIADIHDDQNTFVDHSSDSDTFRAGLSSFTTPTNVNDAYGPPLITSNDNPTYNDHGGVDTTSIFHQEGESVNVPLVQGHQYTQSDTTSSNSEFPIPSCVPTTVQYQEHGELRGLLQQLQKPGKGKGPVVSSPQSSRQPVGTRQARHQAHKPYPCNVCRKKYAQSQGLLRHYREKHHPMLCGHCGAFEWGRPYLYKEHLQKEHPNVNPDTALREAKSAGRM